MTQIHMDVDSVRELMELLLQKKDFLSQQIQSLNGATDVLRSAEWQGCAASMFYNSYDELRVDLMKRMKDMDNMVGELGQAIAEWEAAAARLGQ